MSAERQEAGSQTGARPLRAVRGERRPAAEREPWYVPEITERSVGERSAAVGGSRDVGGSDDVGGSASADVFATQRKSA